MITPDFKMNAHTTQLLNDRDPAPITSSQGQNAILYTGPHNGAAIPACLTPCLGTDPIWFNRAHEARDLHMSGLFEKLCSTATDASYLAGNYSRLVCDLNTIPDYAITRNSSEHKDLLIPANQSDTCCPNQKSMRLQEIYHPYHNTKEQMITQIRSQNGGALVLDLHSFTPVYQGEQRDVEISTIRCEKTPFSHCLEEFFKHHQSEYHFVSGKPYKVAQRPSNAAPLISAINDLQYLGLEIRNDVIDTPEKQERMISFINRAMDYVLNCAQQDPQIIAKRSKALNISEAPPQTTEITYPMI
ncbi:MAG: N-formylglutamate amidohydrolase [Alphaproteobacteria bacterium]